MDGVSRSFAAWTRDFVETYYPDVGQRCYRVPALHFNQQRLDQREGYEVMELLSPVRQGG